jgi:hypothetical protein
MALRACWRGRPAASSPSRAADVPSPRPHLVHARCGVVLRDFGFEHILLRGSRGELATFLIIWAPNITLAILVNAARLGGVWKEPAS